MSLYLRRAAAWKPAEMELEWDWGTKTFDVFLSHKITDAKDIVLGWYNTLSAMTYKPFLDRLSLDKVENIPRYRPNPKPICHLGPSPSPSPRPHP